MDLQEQISVLQSEKAQYIKLLDDCNSEKLALDQMLMESLKSNLSLKKEIIGKNMSINDLNVKLQLQLQTQEPISSISCEKSSCEPIEGLDACS
ncbi:MAG TPA: hypothetical protein VK590_13075 [Saprospiraceae bacterium]|nr:hypothetical protein [Saprospiraceae bacterium]